ncbi:MAG: hypothetical protein VXY99_01715 [Pseudomonadota bacterium]|nr:hypothetical protein [Pseudomonadota bacterium]
MIQGTMMQFGEKRAANVTFTNGRKELSLALDNGAFAKTEKLFRADIRCFNRGKDVTAAVFNCKEDEVVHGDIENMARAMNWLQLSSDPFMGG